MQRLQQAFHTSRKRHEKTIQDECFPATCTAECQFYGHVTEDEHDVPPALLKGASHEPHPRHLDKLEQAKLLYAPIKDHELRLLKLHPSKHDSGLVADLSVGTLSHGGGAALLKQREVVHYTALSYCWGVEDNVHLIRCNGVPLPISTNLNTALRYLRPRGEALWMWVDAVCINQHDGWEKGSQVRKMLEIYSQAHRVCAWLGVAGQHTAILTPFIKLNAEYIKHFASDTLSQKGKTTRLDGVSDTLEVGKDVMPFLCKVHLQQLVTAFLDILSRPWFRRIWIRQESWAAKALYFRYGALEVSSSLLRSTTHHFDSHLVDLAKSRNIATSGYLGNPFLLLPARDDDHASLAVQPRNLRREMPFSMAGEAHQLQAELTAEAEAELINMMQLACGSECKDPRDQVYAVIGMSSLSTASTATRSNANLVIDYDHTISEVYQSVIAYYVERDKSLDILTQLIIGLPQKSSVEWSNGTIVSTCLVRLGGCVHNEALPSWCPNWSEGFLMAEGARRGDHFAYDRSVYCVERRLEHLREAHLRGQSNRSLPRRTPESFPTDSGILPAIDLGRGALRLSAVAIAQLTKRRGKKSNRIRRPQDDLYLSHYKNPRRAGGDSELSGTHRSTVEEWADLVQYHRPHLCYSLLGQSFEEHDVVVLVVGCRAMLVFRESGRARLLVGVMESTAMGIRHQPLVHAPVIRREPLLYMGTLYQLSAAIGAIEEIEVC